MDRLLPRPPREDLPLDALHDDLQLTAGPPDGERAGVTLGMVSSLDGATTVDGVSGGLGGEADRVAFARSRVACDAILVGAGTVRSEDYGPPGGAGARRAARQQRGLAPVPAMVVVTRSAALAPDARLFTDPRRDGSAPLVVATCGAAPPDRRAELTDVAEVAEFGDEDVDLAALLRWCRARGWSRVLCEGGPSLNGQLLAADLVDEILLTISPQLVAGESPRLVTGPELERPVALTPVSIHHHDGELLLRYRVIR